MRICVYCSSSSAIDGAYVQAARQLGQIIGERGHSLIYGGANVGLMGALAREAKACGAHVVGVIPQKLVKYGLAEEEADELIITVTMAERKAIMEERAEAFVALPGGFGTLEELAQVITLKQLRFLRGPIAIVNTQGFYDHLLAHMERMYDQQFARAEYRQLYRVATSPGEAVTYVEQRLEDDLPPKWFDAISAGSA